MIGTPEQDAFINEMKWAVVTSLRKDGTPSNSIIFYAREGDEIFFSTTASRLKAKTIRRDPRIAITVLDEGAPHRYVTLEGIATIQTEDILPGHILINKVMTGGGEWTPPEGYVERLAKEGRLLIRLKPTRVSGIVNRK